jgi:hypothetical protein
MKMKLLGNGLRLNRSAAVHTPCEKWQHYGTVYGQSIDFNKVYYSARRKVLCRVLIQSDILMKFGRLSKKWKFKLCYNKTCKHLSDTFPVKNVLEQGDVLLLFKFAAECH